MHSTSANFEGREQQDFSEDFESDYLPTDESLLQNLSMELVLSGQLRPRVDGILEIEDLGPQDP